MVTIRQDKIEHWAFGFVLTFIGIVFWPFLFLGIIFAIGKEVYDHWYGSGWDNEDMFATLVGVNMALWVVMIWLT